MARAQGAGDVGDEAGGVLGEAAEELHGEVDELELLEFLAADLDPVPADPRFERELKERLWEMVATRRFPRPPRN